MHESKLRPDLHKHGLDSQLPAILVVLSNDAAHLYLLWLLSALKVKPLKKKKTKKITGWLMLCSLLSQEVLFGLAIINKQSEKRCADQKRTENAS